MHSTNKDLYSKELPKNKSYKVGGIMRKIFLGLLVCSHFFCFAQNKTLLDSLQTVHKTAKHDTSRIKALISIAREYSKSNLDTSIFIASQTLKILEKNNPSEKEKSRLYNIIGSSYFRKDNFLLALDYSQKALKYAEQVKEYKEQAVALNTIAGVHFQQKNHDRSLKYLQKSIVIYEILNDKKNTAMNLGNIAMVYEAQDNTLLALEYYQKSLSVAKEHHNDKQSAYTLSSLGRICIKMKQYEDAIRYLEESLIFEKKINDNFVKANTYVFLAKVYKEQKDFKRSEKYGLNAFIIAQRIKSLGLTNKSSEALYETYKEMKDYKQSLVYFEVMNKTQDSLTNVEKAKAIANLEAKMSMERQEKELVILKKNKEILEKEKKFQTTINYFVVAVFLMGVGLILYIYQNWRKEKNSKKQIAQQKEEIEAINKSLESLVYQRTQSLAERNKQLEEYAFYNAHKLRAPVASIMGLYLLLEKETDYEQKNLIFEHLHKAIEDLDYIISEIQEIVAE